MYKVTTRSGRLYDVAGTGWTADRGWVLFSDIHDKVIDSFPMDVVEHISAKLAPR